MPASSSPLAGGGEGDYIYTYLHVYTLISILSIYIYLSSVGDNGTVTTEDKMLPEQLMLGLRLTVGEDQVPIST